MAKHGKKFRNAAAKVDRTRRYSIDEACKLIPETKVAKEALDHIVSTVRVELG
jgi:large subunit ribosomal protein L1